MGASGGWGRHERWEHVPQHAARWGDRGRERAWQPAAKWRRPARSADRAPRQPSAQQSWPCGSCGGYDGSPRAKAAQQAADGASGGSIGASEAVSVTLGRTLPASLDFFRL